MTARTARTPRIPRPRFGWQGEKTFGINARVRYVGSVHVQPTKPWYYGMIGIIVDKPEKHYEGDFWPVLWDDIACRLHPQLPHRSDGSIGVAQSFLELI